MQQENLNTNQKRLFSLLIHYKNRRHLKDSYDNQIVMFFNENYVTEIVPLMSKYTHNKLSRVNKKDTRKAVIKHGIVQIKDTIKLLETNYKLDVKKFVEYGQTRKKDWDYMNLEDFNEAKDIIPKPKKKFINPSRRRRYVISK